MKPIPPSLFLAAALSLPVHLHAEPAAPPPLIAAIRAADSPKALQLLQQPAARQERDARGNSALHWAALDNDLDLVRRLLAAGLDPNATNQAGATPLHYGTGDARIVRDLLAAGARPNTASVRNCTPLHSAASRPRSFAVVKELLDAGAEIEPAPSASPGPVPSPLALAVYFGEARTARLLLDHGAAPGPTNGSTPVIAAAFTGRADLLELLVAANGDVNADEGFAGHALNNVLYANHRHLVPFLLNHQADLHHPSSFGERVPPIVWSAYSETADPAVTRLLLDRGLDVNATTSAGHTALDWALKRGETPLTALLRSRGATNSSQNTKPKPLPRNPVPTDPAARAETIRRSIQSALTLLQRSSDGFLANGFVRESKCVSCHQQTLPAVAFGRALPRGFQLDEAALARQLNAQHASWSRSRDSAYEMREPQPDAPANLGYGLWGLRSLGYAPDDLTEAMVWYLAHSQLPDGSFPSYDRRPPMEEGRIIGTALAIGALRAYPQPLARIDLQPGFDRARRWLERARPEVPNELAFRLLGLHWSGASPTTLRKAAQPLLDSQQRDGAWAPLPTLAGDAWITGLALFALHESGVLPSQHPDYQRGVDFLLRTQFPDGSWWVRSRTWPFQPHFDSSFPHGKDQWISAGATAWAALALIGTLPADAASKPAANAQALMARHPAPPNPSSDAPSPAKSATPAASPFQQDILPLLQTSCVPCHGGDKPKAGLRVDTREGILKGGNNGEPAVIPGKSSQSHLIRYVLGEVEDLEMPPLSQRKKYPALSPEQINRLRAWIDQGAP